MAYGSVAGVKRYTRHMTFDGVRSPATEDIEAWLEERSATLDGWIACAGYTLPIVQPAALKALGRYANLGAAADAELSQRSAGYNKEEQNKRENKFESLFDKAEAWISGCALEKLGVPLTTVVAVPSGLPLIGTLTAGTLAEDPTRQGRHISIDYPLGRLP